ncbi:MAG: hypothetical protein M0Q38_11140 [Bacteroidales bacterium]|jgi:trigger factor|nr:hypothetical protein [Bacteroidales bacterium]
MNITKENTGELTATLKIEIGPPDYTEAVEKQIHDYKRKSNIPGFRPGHIPAGLIKKMYGKAILADEVNKLLSDRLFHYIKEEKLDILGNPLPNLEKNAAIDFENQTDFEFYFDLGLSPEFTLQLDENIQVEYHTIKVDDGMIDKYIEDTRKRYGKPSHVLPDVEEQSSDQNLPEDPAEKAKEPIVMPAEMNPDFFHQVYPGLNIETEEDFRNQVRKEAEISFSAETDKLFFNMVTETLVKNTEIAMPDTFLKRWLLENNEGKYKPEEIENNYNSFAESMKWQLIENKIIKNFGIEVKDEDIRQYFRTFFLGHVGQDTSDPEMEKRYDTIIDKFMENKEQVQRINDQLYNAKLLELFKQTLTMVSKEVTYDDFIKLASTMHEHVHDHEHAHDHEHNTENESEK